MTPPNQLFSAIENNDCSIVENLLAKDADVLCYTFGRFPVLSLCYLFGANSIIKKFKDKLYNLTFYKKVPEPIEAYKRFKNIAGVYLRKYGATSIVTPSEMLALLGETDYLASNCASLKPSQKARDNIVAVCMRKHQKAEFVHDKFVVAKRPLSFVQKIALSAAALFLIICIALVGAALGTVFNSIGFGTEASPFRIYNYAQLQAAANTTSHYVLTQDIDLPDGFNVEHLSARINGNGHTINSTGTAPIANRFSGRLENLTINVRNSNIVINNNHAFFAQTADNNALIYNVVVNINADVTIINATSSVAIAGIIGINRGDILNSTANGILNITNNSPVSVSIGGIVAENLFVGTGTLAQPAIIQNVDNNIDISFTQNAVTINPNINIMHSMGGIAAANEGEIRTSGSSARLSFTGSITTMDIGGIVGSSGHGVHINNIFSGTLAAQTSGNASVFLGGIAAVTAHGDFRDNFSTGTFSYNNSDAVAVGGIFAVVESRFLPSENQWNFALPHLLQTGLVINNYFATGEGRASFGVEILFDPVSNFYLPNNNEIDIDTVMRNIPRTISDIMAMPTFWQR